MSYGYIAMLFSLDCEPCYYGAGCLTECDCDGNVCDDLTGECLSTSCSVEGIPIAVTTIKSEGLSDGFTSPTSGSAEDNAPGGQDVDSFPVWGIVLLVIAVLAAMVIAIVRMVLYLRRYVVTFEWNDTDFVIVLA